jgi:glycosyltransferase involved in cell wall biosynthesis
MTRGVNVIGYHDSPTGLGTVARLVARSLAAVGIDHTTVSVTEGVRPPWKPAVELPYDVNLICVNADMLPRLAQTLGRDAFEGRRTVGFWWWEVDRFPSSLAWAAQLVDEIWVGSDFVRRAVETVVPRPVHVFPLPVPVPAAGRPASAPPALPSGFRYLFTFSYPSVFERKNPLGAIEAFAQAFPDGEATLVIKAGGSDLFRDEAALLAQAAARRANVVVLDRTLGEDEYTALIASADAYVSLHRAEGFGLTIAEAMALGKPAIATGYSGNLDFMTPANSYLVPYRLAPIPAGTPYPTETTWAEPDIDAAAQQLRAVYDDRDEAARRAAAGRESLLQSRSFGAAGAFVADRLDRLEAADASGALERAAATSLRGPELVSNRSWLFFARKLAQPFFRPYLEYDVEVAQLILDSVSEERDALLRRVDELEARLAALEARDVQSSADTSSSAT